MTDSTRRTIRATDHGTTYGYWKGCRCADCREAARIDRKRGRNKRRAREANEQPAPSKSLDWMADAECRGAWDHMYPVDDRGAEQNGRGTQPSAYDLARIICSHCPVTDQCLEYALELNERHGMWGGMTPRERQNERTLRRKRQGAA